ncbi:MAG: DUF3347 domain-containing protein [Lewinellaceae bacterium]|nr:DUF3347 domain-containing protein [Saprospiraceae bacterium]MCB9341386.1 DUF3347 domain-containing protein [Lewinellaceae bacterium]
MKMKLKIAAVAMLLAISAHAQTLEDNLKIAAENNPGIRVKQTECQAALQELPKAKSLTDPTVNASFFVRPMMLPIGNQLRSISVMQMFPWPGTIDAMKNEAARMAAMSGIVMEKKGNLPTVVTVPEPQAKAAVKQLFDLYFPMKNALVQGDLATAKKHAAALKNAFEETSTSIG